MWQSRYLKYFDEIIVAGRCVHTNCNKGLDLSSGKNVEHIELKNIDSIKDFKNRKNVKEIIEAKIKDEKISLIIARLPSSYGLIAIKIAKKLNIPFVIEMVGDPFDAYWNHGKLIGKIYAPISYFQYRKVFKEAKYCIFVTENYLQKKYVSKELLVTENISNVNLEIGSKHLKKEILNLNKPIEIGLIGSYSSKYKGIDTAIEAIYLLNKSGKNTKLNILGSGDKKYFNSLIKKLNIEEKVVFTPSKSSGNEVFEWLRNMDVYIQPSLTEGLPRALIEAMSVGLPAVGTSVGGIPELIDEKMLIDKNNHKQLSTKINELLTNNDLYIEQSNRNRKKSLEFTKENLLVKRNLFWSKVKEMEGLE
ncbi:glycosyltransferase [Macrococcus equi]|uniref:glycosyltransferase n=1 Tax=Macrococcus equi TaxID=3395462 RepID=UPI0039BEA179